MAQSDEEELQEFIGLLENIVAKPASEMKEVVQSAKTFLESVGYGKMAGVVAWVRQRSLSQNCRLGVNVAASRLVWDVKHYPGDVNNPGHWFDRTEKHLDALTRIVETAAFLWAAVPATVQQTKREALRQSIEACTFVGERSIEDLGTVGRATVVRELELDAEAQARLVLHT